MTAEYELTHKLERAGLGKPPYRCVGVTQEKWQAAPGAPVQTGTCCDYCGQGIIDTYWVVSSDGKRFKLGSDCIAKVSQKKDRQGDPLYRAVLKHRREKTHTRNAVKIERAKQLLSDPAMCVALSALPHPLKWRADQGATLLEWAEWMMQNSGDSGKLTVALRLEYIAEQQAAGSGGVEKLAREVKELLR
jgi:hypothetical protein